MSSVFSTSTMKSPPLLVWLTGSSDGGIVSAAASFGPGAGALARSDEAPEIDVLAATGVVRAAAPAIVAPLRKLRRPRLGDRLRFDMASSRGFLDFFVSSAWQPSLAPRPGSVKTQIGRYGLSLQHCSPGARCPVARKSGSKRNDAMCRELTLRSNISLSNVR